MPFLAPIMVLLAIALRDSAATPVLHDWLGDMWTWVLSALLLGLPVIAGWPVHRWLGRRMDRDGNRSAPELSHTLQTIQGLAIGAGGGIAIAVIGLLDLVRSVIGDLVVADELVAGVMCTVAWIAVLLQTYPIDRRLWEASSLRAMDHGGHRADMPHRPRWVLHRLRESVFVAAVPAGVMLAWWETAPYVLERLHELTPATGFVREVQGTAVISEPGFALVLGGVIFIAAAMPLVIARIMPTVRLRSGSIKEIVSTLCAAAHVRTPAIYLWRPTRGWANAAVLGAIPRARAMLLSEALLEGLSEPELRAVIAHEVAHLKYRHVLWLVGAMMAMLLAAEAVWLMVGPNEYELWWDAARVVCQLALVALVFGAVSREFERQADTFAASVVGNPALVATALASVAAINGVSMRRWSFTHGSVQGRSSRLVTEEASTSRQHLRIRWIKLLVVGALAGSITVLIVFTPG